jgi:hypothetical protein
MGSISTFPSLGLLQAALTRAVEGLSAESSLHVLQDIRQVPGFGDLSDLSGLVSQDSLARMIISPERFRDVAHTLSVFNDLPALKDTFSLSRPEERLDACAPVLGLSHGVRTYWAINSQASEPGGAETNHFVEGALNALGKSMNRVLKDELNWPRRLTLETLGPFAVSVRKTFDARSDHLTTEQRRHLMRLAVCLDAASFELCAHEAGENASPSQSRKIAALIEVLFGCGFGDERWTEVSNRLDRLTRNWWKFNAAAQNEELRQCARLAAHMLEEAKRSYHALFDPLVPDPNPDPTGAMVPLSRHLDSLTP